jgi:hypothetical protein
MVSLFTQLPGIHQGCKHHENIAPKIDKNTQQGSQVQGNIKGQASLFDSQKKFHKGEMAGTGNRQKLCYTL